MSNIKKSATLIIASALETKLGNFDYKVMLLKRPKQMKAFPDFHVFPGGKYDDFIDDSNDWFKVLLNEEQNTSIKSNPTLIKSLFNGLISNNSLGNLITKNKNNNNIVLPLEVSFRLCAIREAFEETGILLAKHKSIIEKKAKAITNYYDQQSEKLNKWHDIVKNDSSKFLQMFLDLNLVPDIYGLHEWSNWITPSLEKYRFNTIFFTAFLSNIPSDKLIIRQKEEIERIDFLTPKEANDLNQRKELNLMPPQIYEIRRMLKFESFKQLAEYSLKRSQSRGLTPWLPKFTKDFKVGLLPGDYLYDSFEENDSKTSTQVIELLLKDKQENPNISINRMIRHIDKQNARQYEIQTNIDLDFTRD